MYSVTSAAVKERIESSGRVFGIWLEDAEGGASLLGDLVFNARSEATSTSQSDDIELGAVCSSSWTVSVVDSGEQFVGKNFTLSLYIKSFTHGDAVYGDLKNFTCKALGGLTAAQVKDIGEILEGELIPMGDYICVKAPRQGGGRELTLYDKLYFADRAYVRRVPLPAYSSAVERDVCAQLGIAYRGSSLSGDLHDSGGAALADSAGAQLTPASYDFTVNQVPAGISCRQMLSYIASARGHFGYVDRRGAYVTRWYTKCGYAITGDSADEPTVSEQPNRIVGIVCTVGENKTFSKIINGGKGRILEFENPYMTESLFESLFTRVRNYTWYTAAVDHRLGDPRLDLGDVVDCFGYEMPVSGLSYSYSGGLSAEITAAGLNEEEQILQQ